MEDFEVVDVRGLGVAAVRGVPPTDVRVAEDVDNCLVGDFVGDCVTRQHISKRNTIGLEFC